MSFFSKKGSSSGSSTKESTQFVITLLLSLGILFNLVIFASTLGDLNLPGNHQGFEPTQPIAFSHRLHSGDMQISCYYCHSGALNQRYAGTPASDVCYNCHRFVQATLGAVREEEKLAKEELREPVPVVSDEIRKIYESLGVNTEGETVTEPNPVRWVRVHDLPDYAVFHHGAHTAAGVDCGECHGEVQKMERVRQVENLSMGWCVNCHRDFQGRVNRGRLLDPSIDCITCHF